MAEARRNWNRDQLLVGFNLYCRTPFGKLHRHNPDIIALAKGIGRTASSVAMKLCNFASLDPAHQARGVKGLSGAAKADGVIFEEFADDWAGLAAASDEAMERLGMRPAAAEPESVEELLARGGPTEVTRTIKARRVQGLFRATVLASYDFTCAISGINIPDLLIASHIVPWAKEEIRRLDPRNGVALSVLHDRAFDRGYITFDDDLRIVLSGRLRIGKPTDIHRVALLAIEGQKLRMPTRYRPDPAAVAYHRKNVFVA